MGKNLIVIGFLVTITAAVWIFLNRDIEGLKYSIDSDQKKKSRVNLEEFTVYDYDNHKLESTISGKIGTFFEPNILEVYGNIRGFRHESDKKEYVFSDSAIMFFESTGLIQLISKGKVDRLELEHNVKIGTRIENNVIKTEYAEYLADRNLLRSDLPVSIENLRGHVEGQKGFLYDLSSEDMTIYGPTSGVLKGEDGSVSKKIPKK